MDPNEERSRYVAEIVCVDARRLFGILLRLVCTRAGITQEKLAEESKKYYDYLIKKGYPLGSKDDIGDLGQSGIHRVITGKQAPTYGQVFIWLHIVRVSYEDPSYEQDCRDLGMPSYEFPLDLEQDMFRLALFGLPDEIVDAYERRLPLSVKPAPRRRRKKEPQSDQIPGGTHQVNLYIQQHQNPEFQA